MWPSMPQPAMTACHSEIERPYFFSIDGKYDAGPAFDHGGENSAIPGGYAALPHLLPYSRVVELGRDI